MKHGVTHPPEESEGSTTFGTVVLVIIAVFLGLIVVLDGVTFPKHIGMLKRNLCGIEPEADKEGETSTENNGSVTEDV